MYDKTADRPVWFAMTHSSEGGVLEAWRNLAHGIANSGTPTALFALYPDARAHSPSDIDFAWPSRPTGFLQLFKGLKRLRDILQNEKPSMVFTAMPLANFIFPIIAATCGFRIKIIVTHHTPLNYNSNLSRTIDLLMGLTPMVKSIICVSLAVYKTQPDIMLYRRKSQIIKNALGPDIEQKIENLKKLTSRSKISSGKLVVASGRLSAQKNFELLIKAAALTPDLRFKITGSGPDEQRLKTLANSLGVSQRIDFVGFQPRNEALAILSTGDMFVQPSLYEGHSLALIEAAKLGLPLIVSDVASQVEGITADDGVSCGIAVNVDDVAGLAKAMLLLADDPTQHQRLSKLSLKLGRQSSYEKMLDKYQAIVHLGVA